VDRLAALVAAAAPQRRFAALETLLGRGRPAPHGCADGDALRCALFGLAQAPAQPFAALTWLGDAPGDPRDSRYWLRLDPVTLYADLTRVIMTRSGFAGFAPQERAEIAAVLRSVLEPQGLELHGGESGCWTVALEHALPFDFTPLQDALGMDVAEVLPGGAEARDWRRLLNEVQMALHACPVNLRRRQQGRAEINSVWIWGGGRVPDLGGAQPYRSVCSDHPVSRGLALLSGARLDGSEMLQTPDFAPAAGDVLIDWAVREEVDPSVQLERLERCVAGLLGQVRDRGVALRLYADRGAGWGLERRHLRRWWLRRRPLRDCFGAGQP
jgi:hypothetical protein